MKKFILAILVSMLGANFAAADNHSGFDFKSVRDVCVNNSNSEECMQKRSEAREYCKANKDDKHCKKMYKKKMKRECKENPDSDDCQAKMQKLKEKCDENPNGKACMRYNLFQACREDADSDSCQTAKQKAKEKYCESKPDSKKCQDE
ncbi:MAG: hypothetical protein AAGB35_02275 [Pseudomonadota bacterium]